MVISAEIICIGTEILLGEILNTNAQFLAQQLAALGIVHHYQTVVGDNLERIHRVLAIAAGRSNLILVTGGLGPTPDDLTTEAIASFFDVPLVEHPQLWAEIQTKYTRGPIPANNRKQALLPQGAKILTNPVGTAPGMIWEPQPNLLILTFPGIPTELYAMWEAIAVNEIKAKGWVQEIFYSRVLLYWGISESALAEKVNHLFGSANPTVAPYANYGQARLRITARANSTAAAEELIAPIEAEILQLTAQDCYGKDEQTLASVVADLLRSSNQTLAVAESCTGGWLGQMLTALPGSSSFFLGGVISYSNDLKINLLQVLPEDLETYGAVSETVAMQMAAGVRQLTGSDWGISITGIAGPGGGSELKPVGLVYIAIAAASQNPTVQAYQFSAARGRDWIRRVSACSALDQFRRRFVMIN
ncbi:MAG: competence/damage-inducible protein A [Pseudanabaenaceae cyanobacterium bins.68]|nr:competence/damage-inducible protein A [Pseudanabaenaceae cyanobacterium bins.68]